MNRRSFLQNSAAALVAGAITPAVFAQAEKPKRALKKAVNLGMIKADGASVLDRFKMAKDAGFDGLELNRPDAIPLDEIIKARDATGLEIAGVICSTHWGKPLSAPDPAIVEAGMKGLHLALTESAELGCDRLLLVPGVVKQGDQLRRLLEALDREHQTRPACSGKSKVQDRHRERLEPVHHEPAGSGRGSSMRSAARGSAGTSTSAISSRSAGPSNGCASSGRA